MGIGKNICNTLKAVRLQIAERNGIDYHPTVCNHEGECAGTCPKCEQEVQYLEQQLNLRRALGKAVSVVGISVGLAALSSCRSYLKAGYLMPYPNTEANEGKLPIKSLKDSTGIERRQLSSNSDDEVEMLSGYIDVSEEPAQFKGGIWALTQYIDENLRIPSSLPREAIGGKVMVGFNVETDGSLSDIRVLQSLTPEADAEAIRVVNSMPKWIPGKRDGKPIRISHTIPIQFSSH